MRLVKNAPEGFSDLEGQYVLKVRLQSTHIQCDDNASNQCVLRGAESQREMNSVLMVVSTSGNFNLLLIWEHNRKPSFRAEDDDEYCFVQRGEGLGASVDCQVEGNFLLCAH